MEKTSACGSVNHAYYLCLIDWQTKILDPDERKDFTEKIMGASAKTIDDWKVKLLSWTELEDIEPNVELGFYHSRLIFKFDLRSTFKDLFQIRRLRKKLESKIENHCVKNVIPHLKLYLKEPKEPHIVVYPIFELNIQEDFWRFEGKKPYYRPTTCFFTELDDPEGKRVKMRISGAKIIASDMSEWFFNNLVNLIFHEGLYRQTRKKKQLLPKGPVYKGLENRLEDFASRLMTTFHEYSSEFVRRRIQRIALATAIAAGAFTFISLVINLWKLWNP